MKTAILTLCTTLALAGCHGSSSPITGDAQHDPGTDPAPDTSSEPAVDPVVDTEPEPSLDPPDESPAAGCGGTDGYPCPPSTFCEIPEGLCEVSLAYGRCVEIPTTGCPEYYAPECGCDGITYDNECFRRAAAVQLRHTDSCGAGDVCAPWLDECDEGEMCELPADSCWVDGVMGVCTPVRDDCGRLWDPVCGCNAETYPNNCQRMQAGVALDHWGPCGEGCGSPGDPPCPTGTFCEFPTSSCSTGGMPGECMRIPLTCPDYVSEVCGCDSTTYTNDCHRMAAEVQLDHRGPC